MEKEQTRPYIPQLLFIEMTQEWMKNRYFIVYL